MDRSVIHLASRHNRDAVLKILIEFFRSAGILDKYISGDDKRGNSPLHLASKKGYSDVVERLLKNGADVRNKNEDEETAMHVASKFGKLMALKKMIDCTRDKSIVNDEDEDGGTPLHHAAIAGHTKTLLLLIKSGGHINHRFDYSILFKKFYNTSPSQEPLYVDTNYMCS